MHKLQQPGPAEPVPCCKRWLWARCRSVLHYMTSTAVVVTPGPLFLAGRLGQVRAAVHEQLLCPDMWPLQRSTKCACSHLL